MFAPTQASFAAALLDAGKPVPEGVTSHTAEPARAALRGLSEQCGRRPREGAWHALSGHKPDRRRGILQRHGARIRHCASAALAAPDDLWRRFPRFHRGLRARGGAALSRRRGAAGSRAHARLSRGGCRACSIRASCSEIGPEALGGMRFVLHPSARDRPLPPSDRDHLGDECGRGGAWPDRELAARGCSWSPGRTSTWKCARCPQGGAAFLAALDRRRARSRKPSKRRSEEDAEFDLAANLAGLIGAGLVIGFSTEPQKD